MLLKRAGQSPAQQSKKMCLAGFCCRHIQYCQASRQPTLVRGARPGYAPRRSSAIPSAHPPSPSAATQTAGREPPPVEPLSTAALSCVEKVALEADESPAHILDKSNPLEPFPLRTGNCCWAHVARPRKAPAGRGADTEQTPPPPPPPICAPGLPKPIRPDDAAHSAHAIRERNWGAINRGRALCIGLLASGAWLSVAQLPGRRRRAATTKLKIAPPDRTCAGNAGRAAAAGDSDTMTIRSQLRRHPSFVHLRLSRASWS